MKLNKIVCLAVLCSVGSRMTAQETYPFRNPQLSVEQRVDDLVSRLTLEEKVKQMLNSTPPIDRLGIPAYNWWNECLHGIVQYDSVVFCGMKRHGCCLERCID